MRVMHIVVDSEGSTELLRHIVDKHESNLKKKSYSGLFSNSRCSIPL